MFYVPYSQPNLGLATSLKIMYVPTNNIVQNKKSRQKYRQMNKVR